MDLVEIRKKAKMKKDASKAGKKKTQKKKTSAKAAAPEKKPRKTRPTPKSLPTEDVGKAPVEEAATISEEATESVIEPEKEKTTPVPTEAAVSVKPAAVEKVDDKVAVQETDTLDDILLAQTRKPEQEVEEENLQLLTFTIGGEEYGLSIMDIKEIVRPRETTEVPKTPDYVMGIISLRGIIIPVFDVRMRLGLAEGEDNPKARIIIVSVADNFYGLFVDSVVQVINIPISSIEPPPEIIGGVDADFMKGVGRIDDRLIILLNLEKALTMAEEPKIQEAN